jgi:hypothetical protein
MSIKGYMFAIPALAVGGGSEAASRIQR